MGKQSPALFELVRDPGVNKKSMPVARQTRPGHDPEPAITVGGSAEPEAVADPIPVMPRVEPKPRVTLAVSSSTSKPQEVTEELPPTPPRAYSLPAFGSRKRLPLNASTLSIAAVAFVLIVTLLWATAFKMGQSKAEQAARKELALAGVTDPLLGDKPPLNPNLLGSSEPGSQAAPPAPAPQKKAAPGPTQPSVPKANPSPPAAPIPVGPVTDTRQTGLNYCFAASRLEQEPAERAAAFLRENGVAALAVLEDGSSGSNNPASWRVVVLQGITGQQYRERAPERLKVEAELVRLGEIYRKDPKGRVDFGQFGWEKKKD
jgi:hypothetical protein